MHVQWRAQVATGKTCTVTLTSLHFRQSENSSVQRLTNTVLKVSTVIAKYVRLDFTHEKRYQAFNTIIM